MYGAIIQFVFLIPKNISKKKQGQVIVCSRVAREACDYSFNQKTVFYNLFYFHCNNC